MRTEFLFPIIRKAEENLFLACQKKAQVALGSDAGAYMVMHGTELLMSILPSGQFWETADDLENWLRQGEKK